MAELTAIKRAKKGGTAAGVPRVVLELDGETWSTCSETLVSEFRLFQGKQVDDGLLNDLRERIGATEAMALCNVAVSHRALTERELTDKLAAAGYAGDLVAETIDRCMHLGLVDDARYARTFVESRLRRGMGAHRIQSDLAKRGIDRALIRDLLAEVTDDGQVEDACLESLRRKFGRADLADPKQLGKAQRFLLGRGYSYEQLNAALRTLRDEQAQG